MKVGIATYFWEDNPGQYFQALATYKELKNQLPGATVEFINVKHWDHGWRPSFRPGMISSSLKKRLKYLKARKLFSLSTPLLHSTNRREITNYINKQNYDLIVVGADVLLKPLPKFLNDQLPYYWIDPDVKAKKVMIASSADVTRLDKLSESQINDMKLVLDDFSYLGLRDNMTFKLISDLGFEDKAHRVPDPTFSYDIPDNDCMPVKKIKSRTEKKLCGISMSPYQFNRNLVNELQNRFDIVCVMYPWSKKKSGKYMGPFEWCSAFKHLDLVVTMSFHESIFSFKSGIPAFPVDYNPKRIDTNSRSSKTLSLLTDMDLSDHHISPFIDDDPKKWAEVIFDCFERFDAEKSISKAERQAQLYRNAVKQAIGTVS